ncbi:MAG: hypothetical protein ACK5KM_10235 [Hyphomicrobiaceae bacterium]
MILRTITTAILFAAAANLLLVSQTQAGRLFNRDYGYNGLDEGYVVARSRHGNGSVSGPVRMTKLGPQVRLPGGTWEYCRRSCSETLRVETVDYWEGRSDGRGGLMQECGIFGCLDVNLDFDGWSRRRH